MREELYQLLVDVQDYFIGALEKVRPFFVMLFMIINYVLFPENSYAVAAIGLGGAVILDIITKYYALKKPYKNLLTAIRVGVIRSDTFWSGTKKKIISYLVVMILCGLSVRVAPVGMVAVVLSNIAYSVMFLRESQSCVENLIDAGHTDLDWFLVLVKRKQKTIEREIEKEDIKDGEN